MLKWNTSSILLCGWLALVAPAPSVHCCNSATNDTDKVSFTLCIVDSLKKNFPNIVLVKQDCSTARMQTIMHTFLQWRKQACDINFSPQTVFLLYHPLNFFFFQERCDKEFHFGCISQLCPLGNWEHNSNFYDLSKQKTFLGYFQNVVGFFRKPNSIWRKNATFTAWEGRHLWIISQMSAFSANQIVFSRRTRHFDISPFAAPLILIFNVTVPAVIALFRTAGHLGAMVWHHVWSTAQLPTWASSWYLPMLC